jgi:hypothetical protein
VREKKLWLLATFRTTAGAIAMEKYAAEAGLPGRLIPVPRAITADCGMAWRTEIALQSETERVAREHGIDVDNFHQIVLFA